MVRVNIDFIVFFFTVGNVFYEKNITSIII